MTRLPKLLTSARDTYSILGPHGHSGKGATFLARRQSDGQTVLAKVLRLGGPENGFEALELFERETAVLRALSHPGIPGWLDDFQLGSTEAPAGFALVMEHIPGPTLRDVTRGGGLDDRKAQRWFRQILEVLAHLHRRAPPILHRDVSPRNIILREDGQAFLVDFGAVQAALRTRAGETPASTGTFGYAPPEQFMDRATPASDLFALGMTYLACASGLEPEEMPLQDQRVAVPALIPQATPQMVRLLEAMTEPDPRRRLARATDALELLASGQSRRRGPSIAIQKEQQSSAPLGADAFRAVTAARLERNGFDTAEVIEEVGPALVRLVAHRAGGLLSGASAHVYFANEKVESSARGSLFKAETQSDAVTLSLFCQAAAELHRGILENVHAWLGRRTLVIPVIVATQIAPRVLSHLAATLREPEGVAIAAVLVDGSTGQLHLVSPQSLAADPEVARKLTEIRGWLEDSPDETMTSFDDTDRES